MNTILKATLLALAALCAPVLAENFAGEPGSEQWKGLYNPPYAKPTELPREEPLRKELFDLLRPGMERVSKQKGIKFQGELKAFKNWAFFFGKVLNLKGAAIEFEEVGSAETAALWLRTKDGWTLVDYAWGLTDPFYWQWADQYGVPKALLGVP
jgi:hypothetical protein